MASDCFKWFHNQIIFIVRSLMYFRPSSRIRGKISPGKITKKFSPGGKQLFPPRENEFSLGKMQGKIFSLGNFFSFRGTFFLPGENTGENFVPRENTGEPFSPGWKCPPGEILQGKFSHGPRQVRTNMVALVNFYKKIVPSKANAIPSTFGSSTSFGMLKFFWNFFRNSFKMRAFRMLKHRISLQSFGV